MNDGKKTLLYLLKVHATGLAVLTLLRIILYYVCSGFVTPEASGNVMLLLTALIRGVWFDNVAACYIMVLPLTVCLVGYMSGYLGKWIMQPVRLWFQILWSVVIFISIADIPYFQYFFKLINSSIWNWAEYGSTTLGMLFGEAAYYPPMIMAIIIIILFCILVKRMTKKAITPHFTLSVRERVAGGIIGLMLIGLCIFGIRGRAGYNPIKVSAAYFCEDAFLNQLGVNPTFNLLTSSLDDLRPENKELKLMDTDEALDKAGKFYGWDNAVSADSLMQPNSKNVVLILMESMSASLMSEFGSQKNLTPFLDSLAQHSLLFTNCYSAGIHTNHGLFSTLYSYPALMERNMMKGTNIPHYYGLPNVLKDNGYRTMFFMTHESQYDNMNAFFRTNGFDEIYSQEDYPADKIANNFGVQDDFLFHYAIEKLNSRQPFFASLLTISNHPPYVIPEWFKAKSKTDEERIVEYADNSLREFFNEAKRQPWYDNTIFVLLADHGKLVGMAENEMPQSYNHIPLLIFHKGIKAEKNDCWATQMDVQPTILSMLGIKSHEKNYGISLKNLHRPCVFYTADDVMGARKDDCLYIYRPTTKQEFCYKGNRLVSPDTTFLLLKDHVFFNLQSMQHIMKKHE